MARRIIVCLLLAALSLGGVASAEVEADFLTYLSFEGRYALPDALKAIVQPIGEAVTIGGVCVTLTGAAYDGVWFALGWTVENLRPGSLAEVYVAGVTVDGRMLYADADFPHYEWVPQVFGLRPAEQGPPEAKSIAGMRSRPKHAFEGDVPVAVTVKVGRMREPMAIVDPEIHNRPPYRGEEIQRRHDAMFDALDAYDLRVAERGADPDALRRQGYAVIDRYGNHYIDGQYYDGFDLFAFEDGHMTMPEAIHGRAPAREIEEAVLTFTLDADAGRAGNETIEIGARYDLAEMQVAVHRAVLTPMSTTVDFDMRPHRADSPDAARALLNFYGQMQACDDRGEPLAFGLTGSAMGVIGRAEVERTDGRWRAVCQVQWPGLVKRPEAMHIAPAGSRAEADRARYEAFARAVVVPLGVR